ncbi:MAG: sulfotransferase family protein [Candidatus Heimdallarchaeaceae archaeon]
MKYIPKFIGITIIVLITAPLRWYEKIRFGKKIKQINFDKQPIFVIGHWRSGTTHLHTLLTLDPQFEYMSMAETAFPHLICGSNKLIHNLMAPFTPKKRPTDNVRMSPRMPHEHEFAIMSLCLHSPLAAIAFPRHLDKYMKTLTFENTEKKVIKEFKESFEYMIKKLTLAKGGKQLVLKNPSDTAKVKILHEIFPKAKFVHIYRNPYHVFYSTRKLHKHNIKYYEFQKRTYDLDELIFSTYKTMHKRLYEDIQNLPEGHYVEVKYEDLVANPLENLKRIYDKLSLGDFNEVKLIISSYLDSIKEFKAASYSIPPEEKEKITTEWIDMIEKWGYKE